MRILCIGLLLGFSAPAAAEVVSSSPNGFEVRETVNLVVKPQVAFTAFGDVAGWWDPEHTYSGKAQNLRLDLRPGGCFCESLEGGGGVEHMHVTFVDPGKQVVLTGALGPLLYEAVTGVMDVQVKTAAGGSQLVLDYKAAGFANGGADKLAPVVDKVLAGQLQRYRKYVTSRPRY